MPSSNRERQRSSTRSFINTSTQTRNMDVETEFVAPQTEPNPRRQEITSPRCETFRFPVVSLENLGTGSRQLPREQSQNAERVFRIA